MVAGPEKRSHVVTEKDKRLTAFHEAGHAVATYYCETQDKVHEISTIPRGMAGGYTLSLPAEDRSYMTRKQMFENIITLLGGRIAEQIVLDDISTGASNDLERATKTARSMVTRYGFSEKLGPVVYGEEEGNVFLGRDLGQGRNYSESVASEIDLEIRNVVEEAYTRCTAILKEHLDQLTDVAEYLIQYEKIAGADFEKIMQSKKDEVYAEREKEKAVKAQKEQAEAQKTSAEPLQTIPPVTAETKAEPMADPEVKEEPSEEKQSEE